MDKKHYSAEMDGLRAQIKHWRTVAYAAGAGFLVMAAANLSLVGNTHVVLTPPDINKTFWVEKNNAAPEYIEQMSLFFLGLMMDVTPGNVDYQYNVLKSYIDSEVYGAIETDLAVNADRVKKDAVSQTYFPTGELRINGMSADISGRVVRFVGEKRTSDEFKRYKLTFKMKNGRIYIAGFQEIGNDGKPVVTEKR